MTDKKQDIVEAPLDRLARFARIGLDHHPELGGDEDVDMLVSQVQTVASCWQGFAERFEAERDAARCERDLLVSQVPIDAAVGRLDAQIAKRKLEAAQRNVEQLRSRLAADTSADPGMPTIEAVASHEESGGLWRIVSYYPPQRPFAHLAQLRVVDGAIEATEADKGVWEPLANFCNVVFAEPVLPLREPAEAADAMAQRLWDEIATMHPRERLEHAITVRDGQWRDIRAAERVLQTQLAAQRSEATRQLHQAIAKYKARAEAADEARRVARTAEVAAKTERNRLADEVERLRALARKLVDVALRGGRGSDLEVEALDLAEQIEATQAEEQKG